MKIHVELKPCLSQMVKHSLTKLNSVLSCHVFHSTMRTDSGVANGVITSQDGPINQMIIFK